MMPGAVAASGVVWTAGIISPAVLAGASVPFVEQADQVLGELARTLDSIGSGIDKVLSLTVLLASASDFADWNEAFVRVWPESAPVRTTTVGVFMLDAVLIEVTAVALDG